MKAFARPFSMIAVPVLLVAAALAASSVAAAAADGSCVADTSTLSPEVAAEVSRPHPYPSFCSIPPVPKNVRSAQAFKTAVVATRVAGARLVRRTAPTTWTLEDTPGFARTARSEAAPPPPVPTSGTTQDFIDKMRARATPPPKPH
jgi:hypothetical protein